MDAIMFRVVRAVVGTTLQAGDGIVFDPSAPHLFTLYRSLDPGLVLSQYELGAIIPLMPAPTPAALAVAIGAVTTPSSAHESGAAPRLTRLK